MEQGTLKTKIISKHDLSRVIEDVRTAYQSFASTSGSMNTDYAGFACIALEDFREALQNPDLTCEDLQVMLRAGMREHSTKDQWTKLVASHISTTANENTGS